ncbi:MAG: hypothetical protein MJY52_03505 [Bacteroidaceae bacterium]|nr:hypothetical protein [Bacteroidaceae bacterium]
MKKIFLLVFTACAFAACSTDNDDITPKPTPGPGGELVEMSLSAGFEGDRTVLVNEKDVYFQYDDKINVYTGTETPVVFTSDIIEGGEPATNTNFKGLINIAEGADMFVVYPSSQGSSEAMTTPGTITATIPATQTAIAGTFDPSANISVAKVKDGKIILKNVCALMHFQISEADAANKYVKAVVTADKPLAGTVNINANADDPTFDRENITGGSNTVTLAPNGEKYFSAGDYYISLLPGEYTSVSIDLYDEIGPVASKVKTGTATLTRSKRVKMNPIVDVIPGVFSVSATKKVRFSRGNLWGEVKDAENTIWHIEENQYQDMSGGYDASHVQYIWSVAASNTACNQKQPTMSDDDVLFAGSNFHTKESNRTWGVLTQAEMKYLIGERTNYANLTSGKSYINNTTTPKIDDKYYNGVFFYPDGYEGEKIPFTKKPNTWNEINKAGIVFFQQPGYRTSGGITYSTNKDNAFYLLNTINDKAHCALYNCCRNGNVAQGTCARNVARPVRLVTVVDPGN